MPKFKNEYQEDLYDAICDLEEIQEELADLLERAEEAVKNHGTILDYQRAKKGWLSLLDQVLHANERTIDTMSKLLQAAMDES